MRLFRLSALALAAECAHGYLDTTPFFMFSTSELLSSSSSPIQAASTVVSDIASSLSQCPSDYYILVSQPGVRSSDYGSVKSTPALAKAISKQHPKTGIRSNMVIPDVQGTITPSTWIETLREKCGVESTTVVDASEGSIPTTLSHLIQVKLLAPSSSVTKAKELNANDAFLASVLDLLPNQNYTVLYYTTSSSQDDGSAVQVHEQTKEYEMMDSEWSPIEESLLHLDLKRDLGVHQKQNNQTLVDGPLFDRYQFFTPGIYMGFLVGILLLTILYVAISAVASLQVTYAAFDKETGALAGKKQQ